MQWLGRSNALFRIAQAIPELHANPAAPLMLACWGLGEVIRYPWYALTEAGACPGWLTWLRYSAFVPVYPLGVAAEMALMWRALPLIRARRVFSLAMPNKLNFAFDYSIFMAVRNTVLCVCGGGKGRVWREGGLEQGMAVTRLSFCGCFVCGGQVPRRRALSSPSISCHDACLPSHAHARHNRSCSPPTPSSGGASTRRCCGRAPRSSAAAAPRSASDAVTASARRRSVPAVSELKCKC